MKISYLNFENIPKDLKLEWLKSQSKVMDSGVFIGGKFVEKFEQSWSEFTQSKYCVGLANGLDALRISLQTLGIGPGSVVAVPAHTFFATWLSIELLGAKPLGIDVDSNGLIDLVKLFETDTKIDAVIPVHLHGKMVDMELLMPWARSKGIKVVEDCAQVHGNNLNGQAPGTFGDLGAYSFYPSKNLGAIGDAGAIISNDFNLIQKARSLAGYGRNLQNLNEFENFGINSRLDPLQAAVLEVNLKNLDTWNERRKQIANRYLNNFKGFKIESLYNSDSNSVWHHFIILANDRDSLRECLTKYGISTEIHYKQAASDIYSKLKKSNPIFFPKADYLAKNVLSLPISPWHTDIQIDYVSDKLIEYLKTDNS